MSYSFSIIGKDKADAQAQVNNKMAEIAGQQSSHVLDCEAATKTVALYLDLIDDRAEGVFHVSVSGSVGWLESGAEGARMRMFNGAGINVSVRKVAQ